MGNSLGMRPRHHDASPEERHLEPTLVCDINASSTGGTHNPEDQVYQLSVSSIDPINRSPAREKLRRFVLLRDIFPKIKRARVDSDETQFWISPFERLPYRAPLIKASGKFAPGEPGVDHYPRFLKNLLNRNIRLHMHLRSSNTKPEFLISNPEVTYLTRNIKYVKVLLMHNPMDNKIRVYVEESHGRRRHSGKKNFRPMYVKLIYLDHAHQGILISGGEFMLSLTLPNELDDGHLVDFDGDLPEVVGHYSRDLDTNPNVVLDWTVFAWNLYRKSDRYQFKLEEF